MNHRNTMHQFTLALLTYTYITTKLQIEPLRVTIIAIRVDQTIAPALRSGLGDIYGLPNGTRAGILGLILRSYTGTSVSQHIKVSVTVTAYRPATSDL